MTQLLSDEDLIEKARETGWQYADCDSGYEPLWRLARAIESAVLAKLREQEPIKWTHSCNVLCLDNVELWIDRCPHCGKPADHPMPPKEQK